MTSAITSSVVYKINQLFLFNLMKFPRVHSDFNRKNFSFLSSAPELFYFSTFFGLDSFSFVSEYFPAINEFLCSIQNFIFAFFVTFFHTKKYKKAFSVQNGKRFLTNPFLCGILPFCRPSTPAASAHAAP